MFFKILLACVLLASVYAELDVSKIPEDVKSIIPKEIKDFYHSMTDEEKKVARELKKEYWSFPHDEKSLAALKEKSPSLHEKVVAFRKMVHDKIEKLNDEAKTFVQDAIASLKSLHPKEANEPCNKEELGAALKQIHEKQLALSEAAKHSLEEQFPQTTKLFQNQKVRDFIKAFLNTH